MLGLGNSLQTQSVPSSGVPVFDKTWSFDNDIEGWSAQNMTLDFISSFTPSSSTERTGILRAEDTTSLSNVYLQLDLSSFDDYDSSETLYYSISYSVSSTTDIIGISSVRWGAGGSSKSHANEATADEWSEASGALATSGSNDFLFINIQTAPVITTGEYVHIDYIRASHVDFR